MSCDFLTEQKVFGLGFEPPIPDRKQGFIPVPGQDIFHPFGKLKLIRMTDRLNNCVLLHIIHSLISRLPAKIIPFLI